jgi:hypothetical protein
LDRLPQLLYLAAGDPVARPQLAQFGAILLALLDRDRAARVEDAARGRAGISPVNGVESTGAISGPLFIS